MSSAHVSGLEELRRADLRPLDIVAVCDPDTDRARQRAAQVAEVQGSEPALFERLEYLLGSGPELEAVDICTLHSAHHEVAVPCLEAGLAVLIEKPLGVTMRAARRILDAATRSRSLLAVAEQYRRSPEERARNWAVRSGRIGRPRTFYWQDVSESLGKWGWRSFRQHSGGGWVLDGGVHFADLFRYHLGLQPREVYAVTRQFEPFRYDDVAERAQAPGASTSRTRRTPWSPSRTTSWSSGRGRGRPPGRGSGAASSTGARAVSTGRPACGRARGSTCRTRSWSPGSAPASTKKRRKKSCFPVE